DEFDDGFEVNDDFNQRVFDGREALRQRAFELASRDARLILSLRVDAIAHGLRLRQIKAAVEKSAKGKLARLTDARAAGDEQFEHAAQNHRAAVTTQLDNLFAGVRARHFEVSQQRFINRFIGGRINDMPELHTARRIERRTRIGVKDY